MELMADLLDLIDFQQNHLTNCQKVNSIVTYDVLQTTKTNKELRKKPLSVMYLPVVVMLCFSHIDLRSSTHFSHFTTASLNFW